MELKNLRLNDVKKVVLEILEKKTGKKWDIEIHMTTELNKVKANVQGNIYKNRGQADILISGQIRFKDILKAVAHEVTHLVYPQLDEERDKNEFEKRWKEIERRIKKNLKSHLGEKSL